jgi:putative membrane protein
MTHTGRLTALVAAVVAGSAAVLASTARAADIEDSKFLREAIQTRIAEVKLSEFAMHRSGDEGVRELAHRLQTESLVWLQEAAALAKDVGTGIPSAPSDEALQDLASFQRLSGQEFDAAYVSYLVADHRDAVAKFGEQTHANPNPAIADFAAKALPKLQEHLAMAEALLGDDAHADPQLRVPPQEPSPPRL